MENLNVKSNGLTVSLAGHNVPIEFIQGKTKVSTPEVMSATYARLSRDPSNLYELRQHAIEHVDNAKKSNDAIVFGLGHSSVSEHAMFNIDITGMSRYLVESLQKFRIGLSPTEKSQRYQEMTIDDFMIPREIESNEKAKEIFNDLLSLQIDTYKKLYSNLREKILNESAPEIQKLKDEGKDKKDIKSFIIGREGWAKEDARYALPLATTAQVGITVNARTIENMIPWFRTYKLKEHNDFAEKLYDTIK